MTEDEFWSNVARGKFSLSQLSFCLEWQGQKTTKGYGRLRLNGKEVFAHRAAWEFAHGEIPKGDGYHGVCVLHKCDNPLCVRLSHLKLGTQSDNVKDMVKKGRARGSMLPGEQHGTTKLTIPQVQEIRQRYREDGITQTKLASMYGVTRSCVKHIVNGTNWKTV